MHRQRLLTSVTVAALVSLAVLLVSNDFGITWDEPVYMRNGDTYASWFMHPDFKTKDEIFEVTKDDIHPPLRKLIAGLTHEILTTKLHVIDNTRGYRVSSLIFVFPLITILTYMAIGQFGYVVGILVPLMFSFLPHVLFLAPLVTLDYAVTALWFIAIVTAVKGMKRAGWLVVSGLTIGLAMLTKFYGYLLCAWVATYGAWYATKQKNVWPTVKKIVCIVLLALTVCFVGWPWLWTNTYAHLSLYFRLQAVHGGVAEYIFGKTYSFAPWWYTPVMFLTTTPVLILILFVIGIYRTIRRGGVWDRLIAVNAIFPIVVFSLPGVVRYDWVRLFLPAFPFVCLVAGRGILVVLEICHRQVRTFALGAVIGAFILTMYGSVVSIHPWESAYYNEIIGGVKGAKKIGMETEFWGNSYIGVLSWMNEHKKYPMCVALTDKPFYYYQAMGQLAPDVIFNARRNTCDFYVILMRQGQLMQDKYIRNIITTEQPEYVVSVDGVALTGIYDVRAVKN